MPTLPAELRPLFERYVRGPTLLREAIAGLDGGQMNRKPADGWSIRDIVLHIADAEIVGALQIRLVIAEDDPSFVLFDQEKWQRRLHYLWRDPEGALACFQQNRYATAELLQQCSADTWQRAAAAADGHRVTLANLLGAYVEHVDSHVEQIAGLRFGSAPVVNLTPSR